jgi:short-subunit dehydrogenase
LTNDEFRAKYGPWAVVAGASDGTGAAFAEELAGRGVNVVLVARRRSLLEEVAARLGVETRVVVLDLSVEDAGAELAAATNDLDVGLFIYNAGADSRSELLLDQAIDDLQALVRRNCLTALHGAHHFGGQMVARRRGGVLLVSSFAGWAGSAHIAVYGATKAFDTVLAEALWAEWKDLGVDVLALVLGATNTPALQRLLAEHGGDFGELAEPADVARVGLDHLSDGPTWSFGMPDPLGPSVMGGIPRRQAVELLSAGASAMFGSDGS